MIIPITEGSAKGKTENDCNITTKVMFLLDAVKCPQSAKIKSSFIVIYLIRRLLCPTTHCLQSPFVKSSFKGERQR